MGATTYEWLLRNLDGPWPYSMPAWVMTHRELPLPAKDSGLSDENPDIRFAKGQSPITTFRCAWRQGIMTCG